MQKQLALTQLLDKASCCMLLSLVMMLRVLVVVPTNQEAMSWLTDGLTDFGSPFDSCCLHSGDFTRVRFAFLSRKKTEWERCKLLKLPQHASIVWHKRIHPSEPTCNPFIDCEKKREDPNWTPTSTEWDLCYDNIDFFYQPEKWSYVYFARMNKEIVNRPALNSQKIRMSHRSKLELCKQIQEGTV